MDGLSEKLAQRGETGSVGLFAAAVLDVFFISADVRSLEHAVQINLRELKHTLRGACTAVCSQWPTVLHVK